MDKMDHNAHSDKLPENVLEAQQNGKRVLLAGITQHAVQKEQPLPEMQLLAERFLATYLNRVFPVLQ